jgi:putative acetyltransferase
LKTRIEIPADGAAIRAIHLLAFKTTQEADLVDKLRNNAAVSLSMVVEDAGAIIAHALFSPVVLGSGAAAIHGLGLGPVGVLPHLQKKGIGTQLIKNALEKVATDGWPFVVVLGALPYYTRFGFRPAREFGVHCKWAASADTFMLLPMAKDRVGKNAGFACYREEFDALS